MINRPWEKTLQNQQIQNIAHLHQLGTINIESADY